MGNTVTKMLVGLYCLVLSTPLLQARGNGVEMLKQKDPSGIVLTLTAVSVVFIALVLLVLVFKAVGSYLHRLEQSRAEKKNLSPALTESGSQQAPSQEVAVAIALSLNQERAIPSESLVAAITLALHSYLNEQHDFVESYKLTIRHRPSLWNYKGQSLRKYP